MSIFVVLITFVYPIHSLVPMHITNCYLHSCPSGQVLRDRKELTTRRQIAPSGSCVHTAFQLFLLLLLQAYIVFTHTVN